MNLITNEKILKTKNKAKAPNKLRESQSLKTSTERRRSDQSKNKIKVIKPKIEKTIRVSSNLSKPSYKANLDTTIKSAKVKMILERHRKLKHKKDSNTYRPNETMNAQREKIQGLSNSQRRNKSRSNMSSQVEKGSYLNLTSDSNNLRKNYENSQENSENYNEEDYYQSNSKFNIQERNNIEEIEDFDSDKENSNFDTHDVISNSNYSAFLPKNIQKTKFKRYSNAHNSIEDLRDHEDFYMNAP